MVRLLFFSLLCRDDFTLFSTTDEDLKLNSTVFHWPEHIQKIFELSKNRIGHRKDLAMDEVKRK